MSRRLYYILSIPVIAVCLIVLYLNIFIGTLTIQSGTLDPASISVNGKHYDGTTVKITELPFRVYHITEVQNDYYSATRDVVLVPWTINWARLHPKTTPDGELRHQIRETAANAAAKWGTYDGSDIGSYLGRVKSIATPNLYTNVFLSDSYVRGRDFDAENGTVNKAVPTRTALVSQSDNAATVRVSLRLTASAHGQSFERDGVQTVKLVKVNGAWKADQMSEVSS